MRCSVSWFISENIAISLEVPVLALDKRVGHPVVIVSGRVSEEHDTSLVAKEASSEGSSSNLAPLKHFELTTAEMGSHTWSHHKNGSSTETSERHSQTESGPATFSFEKLLLAKEETIWRLDDLIGSLVGCVIVRPSADECSVEELSTLPDGACKHAWHFFLLLY